MDEKTLKNRKLSRRAFLKAAAATAAAGAAGSFALTGCSPTDDDGGDDIVIDDSGISLVDDYPEVTIKPNFCGVCSANCAMKVEVTDGKVLAIQGNPDDQVSQGKLCVKGYTSHKLLYSADRLKYPMKRTNPEKGIGVDPQWVQITWEEAFELAATGLNQAKEQYGPESIAFISRPTPQGDRLAKAIGTPNMVRHHDTCYSTHEAAWGPTLTGFGKGRTWTTDIANANYILSFGWDQPGKGKNMHARDYAIALEKGAKAVVFDPMLSTTASLADEWIPIKPGTDLAVCLAMINVIINEELYNKDFVDKYCDGFQELKDNVQQYTPQWAASISEVSADKITQIAREFAGSLPAVIPSHKRDAGGPVYNNGWQTSRAMLILNALVGSIDRPGGVIFQRQPSAPSFDDLFPCPQFSAARKDRVDGMEKFAIINALKKGSFHTIAQQILAGKPYPLKAAIVRKHNTMAFPNQVEFVDAMKSLDFIVVMDIIDSEFAQLADVVLPEPHFLEGRGMANRIYFAMYPQIAGRVPAHDALYDTKGFRAIIPALAKAMGLGDYFEGYDSKTEDDEILKSLGSSWDELAANGLWGEEKPFTPKEEFGTPSKKVELYATLLKEHGYDPLPNWMPRKEEPAAGDFTLLVTRPPSHRMTESQSNEAVMELVAENVLWINPKAAQGKGISDGDEVYVESRVGKIKIKAALKEGLRPDCVATYHGFGHWSKGLGMAEGVGGNDGDLTPSKSLDEALKDNDPGLGACMNDYSVKVYKA